MMLQIRMVWFLRIKLHMKPQLLELDVQMEIFLLESKLKFALRMGNFILQESPTFQVSEYICDLFNVVGILL